MHQKKSTWGGNLISRRRMLHYGLVGMASIAGGFWPLSALGKTNLISGTKTGGRSRLWNDDFKKYMEEIVSHKNYQGLPIEQKRDGSLAWFAFAKSETGKARKLWAERKARELGFIVQPGVYAQVMREIHPTKIHVCQICGSRMSIYYHYPNRNLLTSIELEFGIQYTECDHIGDIWDEILDRGVAEERVRQFFQCKFDLPDINGKSKDEIIALCERTCREDGKKLLGPGAMSNFPDRFVGFHYNRCCRAIQDTGRSRENLKSYTKDRRAYEYWSDGNLRAADMFMGSSFFNGKSADHIGPVSLGFVHDPRYLRPLTSSDNSTKRDRLRVADIEAILAVNAATGVYPMSWYSAKIWEFIQANYKQHTDIVATRYRDMLKQNMANYMYILKVLADIAGGRGRTFLIETLIQPKCDDFRYSYEFDEAGRIIKQTPRHVTERSRNEITRFTRIALQAVYDYGAKNNRRRASDLTEAERTDLHGLCGDIQEGDFPSCLTRLKRLVRGIENRIITAATTA